MNNDQNPSPNHSVPNHSVTCTADTSNNKPPKPNWLTLPKLERCDFLIERPDVFDYRSCSSLFLE